MSGAVPGGAAVLVDDDQATITLADGTSRTVPRAEWDALSDRERADLSQPDERSFHLLGDE